MMAIAIRTHEVSETHRALWTLFADIYIENFNRRQLIL